MRSNEDKKLIFNARLKTLIAKRDGTSNGVINKVKRQLRNLDK